MFSFPDSIEPTNLDNYLDEDENTFYRAPRLSDAARDNVRRLQDYMRSKGVDHYSRTCVISCDAPRARAEWFENKSPCLSESLCNGHWISTKKRRMTPSEMLRLQGVDPKSVHKNIPDASFRKMIGAAMSLNVIERILIRALQTIGAIEHEVVDRWENGEAQDQLATGVQLKPEPRTVSAAFGEMRRLIVDSGASQHLIDEDTLSRRER